MFVCASVETDEAFAHPPKTKLSPLDPFTYIFLPMAPYVDTLGVIKAFFFMEAGQVIFAWITQVLSSKHKRGLKILVTVAYPTIRAPS